jgi:hypothetical protein
VRLAPKRHGPGAAVPRRDGDLNFINEFHSVLTGFYSFFKYPDRASKTLAANGGALLQPELAIVKAWG